MDFTDKNQIRQFIEENDIRDIGALNKMLKNVSGVFIEQILEAEQEEHLGYDRYQRTEKPKTNARNGYGKKKVRGVNGEMELSIPRGRDATFEPQLVKKHQTDISEIEDKVISMYAKGMTTRDIQSHLYDIYGAEVSPTTISNMTHRVQPLVEEWRTRPLQSIYAIVYIDGLHYKVRADGRIKEKCVYGVMGVDIEGYKEMLGLWIFDTEGAKSWLSVLTDLRNRGVKDILIITPDGLTGIEDAIEAAFPNAAYQGCVVHVIRNSIKYVGYRHKKEFCADLKAIYTAPTEEAALMAFEMLEKKWGKKYMLAVNVWERNWDRISTMFEFTPEIRTLIYTTNPIESFHRQLRKVTKNRGVFPDDNALLKLLYLATQDVTRKWTMKIRNWNQILAQLVIHFEERVTMYL